MKLILTRHTESTYNVLQICNADPAVDVRLTERGIEQAEALAEKLQKVEFELIITSELTRTKQTAEIVNIYHQTPMEMDHRLNDINAYEGKPWHKYDADRSASDDIWNFKATGDESYADVEERAANFLVDLAKRDMASVLVVTHNAVIRAIAKLFEDLTPDEAFAAEIAQGEYREFNI